FSVELLRFHKILHFLYLRERWDLTFSSPKITFTVPNTGRKPLPKFLSGLQRLAALSEKSVKYWETPGTMMLKCMPFWPSMNCRINFLKKSIRQRKKFHMRYLKKN